MFYYFLTPLAAGSGFFNLFRYLTFRTVGAILTALFIGLFLGKPFIIPLPSHLEKVKIEKSLKQNLEDKKWKL
jgi:hypothetical protein